MILQFSCYNIFLFIMLFVVPVTHAMEENKWVNLFDKNNKKIANIDFERFKKLCEESMALKTIPLQPPIGLLPEYNVHTGLSETQLTFLLKLVELKIDAIDEAISTGVLPLENLTRDQVAEIGLPSSYNKLFDNVVIVRTKDNRLVPLAKNVSTYFFKLIDNIVQEFPQAFVISLNNVASESLLYIYNMVRSFNRPLSPSPAESWKQTIEFIKNNKLTTKNLLTLLEVGDYLDIYVYILIPLYETYKASYPTTEWPKQKERHAVLKRIGTIPFVALRENTSISSQRTFSGGTLLSATVKGPAITSLKGIEGVKDIDKCEILYVVNTNLGGIGTNDLRYLTNIKKLIFVANLKLTTLEKDCFNSHTLDHLVFLKNNIVELPADVFNLPNLDMLFFAYNNLTTIKKDWGKQLGKLKALFLIEPTLKEAQEGWLNGFKVENILGTEIPQLTVFFDYKQFFTLEKSHFALLMNGLLPGQKVKVDLVEDDRKKEILEGIEKMILYDPTKNTGLYPTHTRAAKTISGYDIYNLPTP